MVGFLCIYGGEHFFDGSVVYFECYVLVEEIVNDLGVLVKSFVGDVKMVEWIDWKCYVCGDVGELILGDIINEFKKFGCDL